MNHDRQVILMAAFVCLLALAGAGGMVGPINQLRGRLQLTANEEVLRNAPPEIALVQALGSLRGIAVDVLWMRANTLKEAGKFHEAMQLSGWITRLQPRFPQVWDFHAWNMAYNISVATHTPEERWMWVQNGIRLLREEGIPLNPDAILLYKALGWTFIHKIGQTSDDMHWHYKKELAREWYVLLGEPPQGSTQDVIEAFRPIAEAYEKYVNRHQLTGAMRRELESLAQVPQFEAAVRGLRTMTLERLEVCLEELIGKVQEKDPLLVPRLEPLHQMVREQLAQARQPILTRLLEAHPEAEEPLRRLAQMKLAPDLELVQRVAFLEARRSSPDFKLIADTQKWKVKEQDQPLMAWLEDPAIAESRNRILALARAAVIDEAYKMDPLWMLDLMEGKGLVSEGESPEPIPIDWRHSGAHGLYWASLGVRRGMAILRPQDFDILNTDRQTLHALQLLAYTGKIIFDPMSGYYQQMLDTRYGDAYGKAVMSSAQRVKDPELARPTVALSFQAGHENFLIWTLQQAYFAGDKKRAQELYSELRREYGTKQIEEGRPERYVRPLDEFVEAEFFKSESFVSLEDMTGAITGQIVQAIERGWVNGQEEEAGRFMGIAMGLYKSYQRKQFRFTPNVADQEYSRMGLKPFEKMVADAFQGYLSAPPNIVDPLMKARAWRAAPPQYKVMVFDRVRKGLWEQAQQAGFNPQLAFAEPVGMEAHRRKSVQIPKKPDDGTDDFLEGVIPKKPTQE